MYFLVRDSESRDNPKLRQTSREDLEKGENMVYMVLCEPDHVMKEYESSIKDYGQITSDSDQTTWLVDISEEKFSSFIQCCIVNKLHVCVSGTGC